MKTKQVQYMPDDPVLVFRAALTVRRQMIVDQQEIVRRHADTFDTRVIKNGLKRSEEVLTRITQDLRRIYDGVPLSPDYRKSALADIDCAIVGFQRHLNRQRLLLVMSRNDYVLNQLKAALARMDDLDVAHPEHTFDLIGIF